MLIRYSGLLSLVLLGAAALGADKPAVQERQRMEGNNEATYPVTVENQNIAKDELPCAGPASLYSGMAAVEEPVNTAYEPTDENLAPAAPAASAAPDGSVELSDEPAWIAAPPARGELNSTATKPAVQARQRMERER